MSSKSKFSSILDAAKGRERAPAKGSAKKGKQPAPKRTSAPRQAPPEVKRRGRPFGKRSDPDYEQTTAYVRKQTYQDVKIALIQEGEKREYSELVEELLSGWLGSRK